MNARRILLTGVSGLVGRHLLRQLLAQTGAQITILARSRRRVEEVVAGAGHQLDIRVGDLTHPGSIQGICEGVDVVFHCAAFAPSSFTERSASDNYWRVNVEGTRVLAAEAVRDGVTRFVYVSSTAAMGAPKAASVDETTACTPCSPYEVSKREAERALLGMTEHTALTATIVRPCLIAGEGKRGGEFVKLFRLCRRGLFPVFGHRLDIQKPLIWVDDLVRALLLAASRGGAGEIYLVHSGAPHTLGEILMVAGELVGRARPYRNIPLPIARATARVMTPLARIVGLQPLLTPERLALFLTDRAIDISKAKQQLGYRPEHQDLREMLSRTYADLVRTGQL